MNNQNGLQKVHEAQPCIKKSRQLSKTGHAYAVPPQVK